MREHILIAAMLGAALLAGCSGGGGGSPQPITNPTTTPTNAPTSGGSTSQSQAVINDANAFGSPLKDDADFDKDLDTSAGSGVQASSRDTGAATGTCNDGVEFFSPDRAGDTNSTETLDFYDAGCTLLARDVVRHFTSTGANSESVAIDESDYAPGNATAIATRSESHTIANATFNANGFPIAADGFDLVANDALSLASSRTIVSGRELVMEPASSGSSTFCSDSSGYNATGFAKLGETFGWAGGVLGGGTRVVNADRSVTWTETHAGTTYKGTIGGLSIVSGTQNTACPISTPMFTLGGGAADGTYSIPVNVTYLHGMIESLTITNATLSNGTTLNVTTNDVAPSSAAFITGSVSNGGTQLSTFGLDAFGDGTLTITKTGAEYAIVDWHVVR